MRRFVFLFTFAGMALWLGAVGNAQNDRKPPTVVDQQPTGGIDAIMAYAGTWKGKGERFATAHSDAGKDDTTLRNDCWKSAGYVACNQFVNGESKVLLVYTYNDLLKTDPANDKAVMDKAVKEMNDATKNFTFGPTTPPPANKPADPPPKR